jgi:acetyl-CoA acetyltransferase
MDNNDPSHVAHYLGLDALTFFTMTPGGGGGACGTVALASQAVSSGVADVVVCYRAMNERSGVRFGQPFAFSGGGGGTPTSGQIYQSFAAPYGMVAPATALAQTARRYMHQYGATSEDFGLISVSDRQYAATNPKAFYYGRPITMEDHQNSRMIADPLHLLDLCQESDGSVAIVVTSLERAKGLAQPPVSILGAAQGLGANYLGMAQQNRENMAFAADTAVVAKQLWEQSGLRPADMDLANIYDHFTPSVLMVLEGLGFCGPGEAPGFICAEGIHIDGRLPLNTNGGQLGEAYIHGYNGITEVVRQLRGTAVNQVRNARSGVVTSGGNVPTSGLVLATA